MKQYTSRELSERLVKLGCKSQSGFVYRYDYQVEAWQKEPEYYIGALFDSTTPAFEFEDFCGTHEQADKNLIAIFKLSEKDPNLGFKIRVLKTTIVSSEDWLKYIEKVMGV